MFALASGRLLLLAPFVLAFGSTGIAQQSAPPAGPVKQLLLVQHTLSARPWQIDAQGTAPYIDSLPFEGFTYNLPTTWDLFRGEYGAFDEATIRGQFGSFNHTFSNLTRNFVAVVIRRRGQGLPDGDFFDDQAWADTIAQLRVLARVAREPQYQCVGICFDPEEYFEPVWNYPDDVAYAQQHSLAAYRDKARQRGREFAEALFEEWPDALIHSLHGPYLSAPERALPSAAGLTRNQVGAHDQYELLGPFQFGFLEATDLPGRVFDGGEVYQYRSTAEFGHSYKWRTRQMGQSVIVPPHLRGEPYESRMAVTFGLYPYSWPDPERDMMTPRILESTLTRAYLYADDWLWVFSEASRDLLKPGGSDKSWIDAIRQGRLRADRRR
ncbi:MAG: hypothetical protein AB8H80_23350 [Planctomycetota bacterium]